MSAPTPGPRRMIDGPVPRAYGVVMGQVGGFLLGDYALLDTTMAKPSRWTGQAGVVRLGPILTPAVTFGLALVVYLAVIVVARVWQNSHIDVGGESRNTVNHL